MDQSRPQFLHRFDDPPQNAAEFIGPAAYTVRGVAGRRAQCPSVIETFGCEALVPAQPLGASAPPDRGRWLSACRRRSQPLSPTASPQSILRYELGACPPSGEPVTPHFPASPHMPPNTASHGASAPAGTRLTCSPTAAGKLPSSAAASRLSSKVWPSVESISPAAAWQRSHSR